MKKISFLMFLLVFSISLFPPKPVFADGFIIPDRPIMEQLVIRYHHVDVKITNQLAVTTVDQTFYNPNDWTVEGIYSFPIPKDAGISSFKLWIDGKEVAGKLLDANQARQQYEDIVRTMRDPALLEYTDRGAVQVRIFPIASGEERRIQLGILTAAVIREWIGPIHLSIEYRKILDAAIGKCHSKSKHILP